MVFSALEFYSFQQAQFVLLEGDKKVDHAV